MMMQDRHDEPRDEQWPAGSTSQEQGSELEGHDQEHDNDVLEVGVDSLEEADENLDENEDEIEMADRIDAEFSNDRMFYYDDHGDDDSDSDSQSSWQLPHIMGQNDPRRMKLTVQEHDWARAIKTAMQQVPELPPLNDFWYAQYAIVCRDNVDDAVQRALDLQAYREEYRILDTLNDGVRRIRHLIQTSPQRFLALNFSPAEGTYVMVQDLLQLDVSQFDQTPQDLENWFAADYYLHQLLACDLETIRKGDIMVVETQGFHWLQKRDHRLLQRLFQELIACYPFQGTLKFYHTGTIFNALFSFCRMVLPTTLKEKIQVGLQSEARLDSYFFVPTVEEANKRLLVTLEECLQRRYKNEQAYRLDE